MSRLKTSALLHQVHSKMFDITYISKNKCIDYVLEVQQL